MFLNKLGENATQDKLLPASFDCSGILADLSPHVSCYCKWAGGLVGAAWASENSEQQSATCLAGGGMKMPVSDVTSLYVCCLMGFLLMEKNSYEALLWIYGAAVLALAALLSA